MRLAITHATCWPEIRRGSERMMADMARVMAGLGHEVTVLSTTPSMPLGGEERRDGAQWRYLPLREPPGYLLRTRQVSRQHLFAWDLRPVLLQGGFDSVFCMGWLDAAAALRARRDGARCRIVAFMTGIPIRAYFRRTPLDGLVFRRVLAGADEVMTVSRFAQERLRAEFGRQSRVMPSPVDTAPFAAQPRPAPDGTTRILFVGDADEPRKGAVLLARAYALARGGLGDRATLGFSGRMSPPTRAAILDAVPEALHAEFAFHGVGAVQDLPRLLAEATIVANPAVWEALGMVLIEALAAGTPVVGCAHGGTLDIIDDPRIGALFDPGPFRHVASNAAGLAQAILDAAALAALPGTAAACRARAQSFSWDALAPDYARMLQPEGAFMDTALG